MKLCLKSNITMIIISHKQISAAFNRSVQSYFISLILYFFVYPGRHYASMFAYDWKNILRALALLNKYSFESQKYGVKKL